MGANRRGRPRRVRRLLSNAALVVVLVLTGLGAAAVFSGQYQVRPILSGSMRPGLALGGVVVTERVPISALKVRDVVVFHRPDRPEELVAHRIVLLTPGASGLLVKTQGDANAVADPWTVTFRGDTAYRAVFSVPLAGYVGVWAHSAGVSRALVVFGLLLAAVGAVGAVVQWRRSARVAPPDEIEGDGAAGDSGNVEGRRVAPSEELLECEAAPDGGARAPQ